MGRKDKKYETLKAAIMRLLVFTGSYYFPKCPYFLVKF
jgi:hypothetical protein